MTNTVLRLAAAATFVLCGLGRSAADDCHLAQIASLDVEQTPHGLLVPVTLEGKNRKLLLDTGSPLSVLDPGTVTELGLVTQRIFQGEMFTSSGQQFSALAKVRDLKIGNLNASDVKMLVYPSQLADDKNIAGLLGANFLRHYEIELDLSANKLNLFQQDHCPGQVVYWKAAGVAVAPMRVVESGHIIVPVTLDGQKLDALLDTGSNFTLLSAPAALQYFNLTTSSPGMTPVGDTYYKHVFEKLDLDGVAIAHPSILIRPDSMEYGMKQSTPTGTRLAPPDERSGTTPVTLGMNEMKHLRIFISYKEEKLYITSASAPESAATLNPATAVQSAPKP